MCDEVCDEVIRRVGNHGQGSSIRIADGSWWSQPMRDTESWWRQNGHRIILLLWETGLAQNDFVPMILFPSVQFCVFRGYRPILRRSQNAHCLSFSEYPCTTGDEKTVDGVADQTSKEAVEMLETNQARVV